MKREIDTYFPPTIENDENFKPDNKGAGKAVLIGLAIIITIFIIYFNFLP